MTYFGGSWEEMKASEIHRHHPVAWSSLYKLTSVVEAESPVYQMHPDDHGETLSYKGFKDSDQSRYRQWQEEYLIKGRFWTAWNIDEAETRQKFGDKYDQAIAEAREQAKQLEAQGKLKIDEEKLRIYREKQELEKQKELAEARLKEAKEAKQQEEEQKLKAEKERLKAELALNKAKLEERHKEIEKRYAEQKLEQAKQEEKAKYEAELEKAKVNLEKAQRERKELEAKLENKQLKEDNLKLQQENEQLKANKLQDERQEAYQQQLKKQSEEAKLHDSLFNLQQGSPESRERYNLVVKELVERCKDVKLEYDYHTTEYKKGLITLGNGSDFEKKLAVDPPEDKWKKEHETDAKLLKSLFLQALLTDLSYKQYVERYEAKLIVQQQQIQYSLQQQYGHGHGYRL